MFHLSGKRAVIKCYGNVQKYRIVLNELNAGVTIDERYAR